MISRIDEEEEKAAGKIYQIAQKAFPPFSQFAIFRYFQLATVEKHIQKPVQYLTNC